tara:strand:- start:47 stop:295 length:249 start_codon:yes stop_codon:yes gene_type:complete
MKFANISFSWLNKVMKSSGFNVKEKLIEKYLVKDNVKNQSKSTNINVLLNRVRAEKKSESMKKIYFSFVASTGLVLFGFLIF